MSKLAKIPIDLKEGVTVSFENNTLKVKGAKGTLSFTIPNNITVNVVDRRLQVSAKDRDDSTKALLGLTRATIANMATGVSEGFSKKLELSGVGYRALISGNDLILSVGFSHPVVVTAPNGINFSVSENVITVSGIDKHLVGDIAAKVRLICPPNPYKDKGIKYVGERIIRKAGKAAKTLGTK